VIFAHVLQIKIMPKFITLNKLVTLYFFILITQKIVPEEPELRGGAQYTKANGNIGQRGNNNT